jgi:hypothetical protein
MEERETAAIVLSVIALVIIFYTAILPEIRFRGTQTLSFKGCTVHFKYFDKGLVPDADRAANNKLALCLCDVYAQKPDSAVANRILKIYREYGTQNIADSNSYNHTNLDSLTKNKKLAFDTLILLD